MNKTPYTIIFIGPQGSGKGTQIELLTKVLKEKRPTSRVVDIQTGRRFRALAAKGEGFTEKKMSETLDSGMLQPLFLSVVLWGDAFHHHVDPECEVLIDGFPRTANEAKVLDSALSFYRRNQLIVINLETGEEVVRERMIQRARPDDTPNSIEARLIWYREETLPVLAFYREREDTTVIDCDGSKTIEEVHREIVEKLEIL
ncbi:MAG: nucleoside monophosphate kinase [Candidatus Pacebacteria bacterium]|nr:nucleoside monophosphate kinase [Candidatus Paceibacterota bacterium]MCF7857404.1 nucleoside monophosphate kinase [Candidatus Paceibacterota bacterium]